MKKTKEPSNCPKTTTKMNDGYPAIIGFSGPARSGKDTAGAFVQAELGGYLYAFAEPMKQMLRPLGINMSDPYWEERKDDIVPALGVSPRRLMQTLGTEWGRELINPELWVLLAKMRFLERRRRMIITDVRFENEADFVRSNGGIIVHMQPKQEYQVAAHISEDGIDVKEGDKIIVNDGSLEDLQTSVRSCLDVKTGDNFYSLD